MNVRYPFLWGFQIAALLAMLSTHVVAWADPVEQFAWFWAAWTAHAFALAVDDGYIPVPWTQT